LKPRQERTIESHRLSDGTLAEVTKYGRTYTYMHTAAVWPEAPFVETGLNKAAAMELLIADLQADVMELD
jgi:hypothetical protein